MTLSPERWHAIVRGEARDPSAFILRRVLWLAQWPYRVGVWWRNRRFDKGRNVQRVSVPVICVGNLTVGGTGKTPCVEYVARLLREHECMVAVLSRGYGAEGGRNDEAMVLEENLPDVPHYQDRDRVALAHTAIEESESDVLVLDDGFQHRRLARDLDIVLIDATDTWGSGYLFPRGGLREPRANLKRAGIVMLTRCDSVPVEQLDELTKEVNLLAPGATVVRTIHAPIELLNGATQASASDLAGRTVAAFCGIGNPEAFRTTLKGMGATIIDFRSYPDHHAYRREDVEELKAWAANLPSDVWIATTQKDWVKLRITELSGRPLWAVRVGLQFQSGQTEFDKKILDVVGSDRSGSGNV